MNPTSREMLELAGRLDPARAATVRAQLGGRRTAAAAPTDDPPAVGPTAPRSMNGLESAYAAHLRNRQLAGEVRWFAFEPLRLAIATGRRRAFYTPDFVVVLADGSTEVHETKGHWREAARVRIKVAAGLYPWPFVGVRRVDGRWEYERFA